MEKEIKLNLISIAREDLMHRFNLMLETFRAHGPEKKEDAFGSQLELIESYYPSVEAIVTRADEMLLYINEGSEINDDVEVEKDSQ
jgi:hypothetical protein